MADEIAKAKYRRAVKLLEQAEALISEACGELCPLVGAVELWTEVGDHYDKTKALARKLAYSYICNIVEMEHD